MPTAEPDTKYPLPTRKIFRHPRKKILLKYLLNILLRGEAKRYGGRSQKESGCQKVVQPLLATIQKSTSGPNLHTAQVNTNAAEFIRLALLKRQLVSKCAIPRREVDLNLHFKYQGVPSSHIPYFPGMELLTTAFSISLRF